jgi:hypothetical protein
MEMCGNFFLTGTCNRRFSFLLEALEGRWSMVLEGVHGHPVNLFMRAIYTDDGAFDVFCFFFTCLY